jgi:3alpha(or 20beta)-hydroxysteroid dehydrogenase
VEKMLSTDRQKRLSGKRGLISGAARGIGAGIAEVLAASGAAVMITDVLEDQGKALAEKVRQSGGQAQFHLLNVTDEDQWVTAVNHTIKTFGGFDFVVNNAGVELLDLVENTDFEKWCRLQDINSDGVFLGTKHAIRAMKPGGPAGRGGAIVNMSSIGGMVGTFVTSAYNASKGLVRTFTKAAAVECGNLKYGIRVNSVHPGMIRTPMIEEFFKRFIELGIFADKQVAEETIVAAHPIGFAGEPEDVAWAVAYLVSDESRFMTGAELVIDGGYTAQ